MKRIVLIILVLLVSSFAEAKVYVCLDKSTEESRGTVDISEGTLSDWAKKFIMIEADESYRGKQGYEIKYEDKKLRPATQAEISAYKAAEKEASEANQKENALKVLGLTTADIAKIKALEASEPIS